MDHATTGRHPLHATAFQQAFVPRAVTVQHAAGQHVGDGLEATMRMVGKAGNVVIRLVAAKGIKHQEGIEPALQILREHAGQPYASAIGSGYARDQAIHAPGLLHRLGNGKVLGLRHGYLLAGRLWRRHRARWKKGMHADRGGILRANNNLAETVSDLAFDRCRVQTLQRFHVAMDVLYRETMPRLIPLN